MSDTPGGCRGPSGPGGVRENAAEAQCVLQPARVRGFGTAGRGGRVSLLECKQREDRSYVTSAAAAVNVVKLSCDQVDKGCPVKVQRRFRGLRTSAFQSSKAM